MQSKKSGNQSNVFESTGGGKNNIKVNLLCNNGHSKSGTYLPPKIKPEDVPDLLKRVMEKNKKVPMSDGH